MKDGMFKADRYTVYTYDRIDSTNDVAKRAITVKGPDMDRSAHITGEQTSGKGRQGRKWLNTEGALMMSIVRLTRLSMRRMPTVSLAAAAAVRNALVRMTDGKLDISIKWPNDIVTSDRMEKLCGILCETFAISKDKYVIVGIGVNLNAVSFPEGLLQPATSVYLSCGKHFHVFDAAVEILREFDVQYRLLQVDAPAFLDFFSKNCITLDRHVTVNDAAGVRYGYGEKLAGEGQLIVRFEDGTSEAVLAADVSIRNQESMTESLALKLRPNRKRDSNKGDHGRALIIAGSDGMPGAALMCTKACIRAGSGLPKVLVTPGIVPSFALIPEAMLCSDDGKVDELIAWASVILIGCGMGVNERTASLLEKALRSKKTCIIDADGINTLAAHRELLELIHERVIITPHPAEFARLCEKDTAWVLSNFTPSALDFAREHQCTVLLKSNFSVIASADGRIRYNDRGCSALAKGGSGDVLAGLVTGFAAQGSKPFNAASLGSYLLGVSAENALEFLNNRYTAAGDIIDMIGEDLRTDASAVKENDIAAEKAELRKRIRADRRALSDDERARAADSVAERLSKLEVLRSAKYVLAYMPMKYELDISPAAERLEALGVKTVYPLCIEDGGLRLFVPAAENGFVKGAYGIMEPDTNTALEVSPSMLDAIILPAIGFDRKGHRLGQGGGYYDRLLARTDCCKIAVGFDCQLVESVPTEDTDKNVDAVVTPSETIFV